MGDLRILGELVIAGRGFDVGRLVFGDVLLRELCGEFGLGLLIARWRDIPVKAALLCAEGDVLMDGGGRQSLADGEFSCEFSVRVVLVGQLSGERIEDVVLIGCGYAVRIGKEREDVLCTDGVADDDAAALDGGRRRGVMAIDRCCMTAVIINGDGAYVLLVEDAACRFACAAEKVRDMAFCGVDAFPADLLNRARTDVLIVLVVACVAPLIQPLRAVLEIDIGRTAAVYKTVEIGLVRHECDIELTLGQGKEIAVELYVLHEQGAFPVAGGCSVVSHIHENRALVGSEGIVAVLCPRRHRDVSAAGQEHLAACGVCRDAVAVDGHVGLFAHDDFAAVHLCQDAGIVKA